MSNVFVNNLLSATQPFYPKPLDFYIKGVYWVSMFKFNLNGIRLLLTLIFIISFLFGDSYKPVDASSYFAVAIENVPRFNLKTHKRKSICIKINPNQCLS